MTKSMLVVFDTREEFEGALQMCSDNINEWLDISDADETHTRTIKVVSYKYEVSSRSITLYYEDELIDN